ncbi:type II toxin-antitoxin system RelE/ParE family toxin [Exiguobacterium sp. s78]|uniref:type II toxin-antitoxin system RelE/ParE family toxin n=1 Tax=Exiguobacterium sp. s78 TaxID=2751197 RepID=UPI001BEA0948|nr:type II toxin-antitoxin system RelE/ParE family toxin [Exiguobacterium sp. s78]
MKREVRYTSKAKREIKSLIKNNKSLKSKFKKAIEELIEDPNIGEAKKGDLEGLSCYDVTDAGVSYEIAYRIEYDEDGEPLLIILAGTRENFYDQLKRYLK